LCSSVALLAWALMCLATERHWSPEEQYLLAALLAAMPFGCAALWLRRRIERF
jgi:hypothetical protein